MKKIIAREFLWFLTALLIAVPMSILILGCFDFLDRQGVLSPKEKIYVTEFFLLIYFFSFIIVYIFRLTVLAIRVLVTPPPEQEEK